MFGFFRKKQKEEIKETPAVVENFDDVEDLITYFKKETGLDFFNKKEITKNKLILFCRKRDMFDFKHLYHKILEDQSLKQELVDYLAVNETYFYRETPQIKQMIQKAELLGYKVEILCAPSSSGEEPYTIAMMLLEAGFKQSDFHIVGIDISQKIISKAREAKYNERSLHRVSDELKQKYFTRSGDFFILKDIVKDRVSFRRVNIFDESLFSLRKFDFIFSRNMMIYFDSETKIKAKAILQKLLKRPEEPIYFGHADMVG
jgi:chemotaxis protein methyltransferase CheR